MEQRTILFRGKRLDNGEWVYGYYVKHDTVKVCFSTDDPKPKHYIVQDGFCDWGFEPPVEWFEVDPKTVGQCTGMHEFVMLDKSKCAPLFEGDIVELWSRRRLPTESYYTEKSQYDGECKIRAVIVFKNGQWRLDYDNEYNNKIAAARGNEMYDRAINRNYALSDVYPGFRGDMDKYRELNQRNKSHDIVRIGNIYDNPKLLEGAN